MARASAPPAATSLAESTCADCHAAAAEEWRGSMHHASFTSEDFQRSYAAEKRDYCVACHAPLEDRTAGIGCTACHSANREHASLAADRSRATTKGCKSCHDFDVPRSVAGAARPKVLQATEREHQASAFADRTCESCHMKSGGHRFDVTRNRDFLAKAVDVQAASIDGDALVVRIASRGVGHRFPTGDLFRRLTVTVAGYAGDALTCGGTFFLRRGLDAHRTGDAADDTRLDARPRDLRVTCGHRPTRVHVTVTYERGFAGRGDDLDSFATLDLVDEDVPLRAAKTATNTSVGD